VTECGLDLRIVHSADRAVPCCGFRCQVSGPDEGRVWAPLIGGSFSDRAQSLEQCFSSWGMFLYAQGYWDSNGAGCLALPSDTGESEGEVVKRSCFEALSGPRS
jgi:hypothetical protein